jgi:hypothetical protein
VEGLTNQIVQDDTRTSGILKVCIGLCCISKDQIEQEDEIRLESIEVIRLVL